MDTDADLKGVVVEMAEHIAENLPPSEQLGFHHVIKMVRDGTVSANFLSQMLKEMKKNSEGSTGSGSWSGSPTHSEGYWSSWSQGDVGQPLQGQFSWAEVSQGKGKQSFQPDVSQGKGNKVSNLMFHKEKENKVSNLMFHKEKENKVSNLMFHKEKENKVSNLMFHKEKEKGKKEKENNIHLMSSTTGPVCRCGLTVGVKDLRAKKKGRKAKEDTTTSGESSQTVVRKRNTI